MRIMSRGGLTTLLCAMLAALAATSGCGPSVDYMSAERVCNGLVFSLDGVGGYNWGPRWLREGLEEGGVKYGIYIFDWGHGPAGMFVADLWDVEGNKKRAGELAELVERYQKSYPGRPVYLIGHSGGGGMVVFALEEMKAGVQVDDVFLLAPALDPDRNLAPALAHVRNRCYVTYSKADLGLMGLGTTIFTTMDGKHKAGAGLVGFNMPAELSEGERVQYGKLLQAGWEGSLLKVGHFGGHMGWTSAGFAKEIIAPILLGREAGPIFKPMEEKEKKVARKASL